MMEKFLVLGIGNAQVDLLRYLKKLNRFEVHALSNSSTGRGIMFVDKFKQINIVDKDAVLEYAKNNEIDYIYSVGSDVAMPTVAYVSEKLSLNSFVSYEVALTCNNKHLFRSVLSDCYGAIPYIVISDESELEKVNNLRYPIIVKPVDSQGQRGVSTVTDENDLVNQYKYALQYSRCKKVILEEKIIGEEISVNAYLSNGEIKFFLPSGRVSWDEFDGGIIHKHTLPSRLNCESIENVRKLVSDTLNRLGITDGPAYFQIKMSGNIPYLIEVTPRFDGCHMWRLINESCDINLLKLAVDNLTGCLESIPYMELQVKPYCLEFYCQPPHQRFKFISPSKNSVYNELYYQDGDIVQEMNGKMEKCGFEIYPVIA